MAAAQRHRVIRFVFGVTIGLLAWISMASYWTTHTLQAAFHDVTKAEVALNKFQHIEILLESASSSVVSYVLSGEQDRLNAYYFAKQSIPVDLQQIDRLLPSPFKPQAAFAELTRHLDHRLRRLERIIRLRQTQGEEAAKLEFRRETGAERDQFERLLSQVRHSYLTLAKNRTHKTDSRAAQTKALLALATLFSCILVVWTYILLRRESAERAIAESVKGQTETLLHSVIERIPYMILLKDAEHLRIVLANGTAARWLGKAETDLEGALESEMRNEPESRHSALRERQALGEGFPVETEESLRIDGKTERLLHTQKIPLLDDNGKPVYVLSISEDITEQKQAEKMLQLSRDAAVEAVRLRSEFIRNMSHELRTPLSIVIGMASLMQDTELTEQQRRFADTIRKSAENLAGLTKNILDFSRIETGTFSFETRELNVMQVTDDVVGMLNDQARVKGVGLVTLASPDVPPVLRGDASRVRQVLTQLVTNAVKFTERGQISVRLTLAKQTDQLVWVRWQITDTGIGIHEDVQKHLFEPFRQGDGSWTRRHGGTGLGLAMAKRIVELLGGEMQFQSASNMGSTFSFTLPLQKRHVKGPDVQIHSLPWSRAHVLVVSENDVTRQTIRQQLNDCALSCEVVSSGQAALEILRRQEKSGKTISLVLLDMHVADMDAVHLAKTIKNDEILKLTRLALMIGDKTTLDQATMMSLGFLGWVRLPCTAQDLYGQLAKWMDPGEQTRSQQIA